MLDVFDIIDLDIESVKEYKKYLIFRYFNLGQVDIKPYGKTFEKEGIKYKEVCLYNEPLDYYTLESNYPSIALCELDLDNSPTHELCFVKLDLDKKEDIKEYLNKVDKFIKENISRNFLNDIAYTTSGDGKVTIQIDLSKQKDEYGNYKKEFLDRASKYVLALSLRSNTNLEYMLYKKYFELDNK